MMRGGAAAARVAHNHKVAGSSPAPATKIKSRPQGRVFNLMGRFRFCDRDFLRKYLSRRDGEYEQRK